MSIGHDVDDDDENDNECCRQDIDKEIMRKKRTRSKNWETTTEQFDNNDQNKNDVDNDNW